MRKFYLLFFCISTLVSCKNLDGNDPSPLTSFVKFYEGPYSMTATSVEKIPSGYAVLANMISTNTTQTILFETDDKGNRIGDFHTYDNITSKSFKPIIKNGTLSGYLIVGDSVAIDPFAEQAANVEIYSMSVLFLNSTANEVKRIHITDSDSISLLHPIKKDYYGGAINVTDDGGVIILGTYKEGVINQQNAPEQQLLFGLTSNLDSAWVEKYPLLGNTYANGKSIHYSKGDIIWASAIADVQGNFVSSFLAIPLVKEKSNHKNFSLLGESSIQLFLPSDIKPAASAAFGYGVVGTYSQQIDGSKSNIFFVKVLADGTIVEDSEKYFDAISSFASNSSIDKNSSNIIDEGKAITSTNDGGFVLAGSMATNSEKGNGGKDIFLIKLNASGEIVWMKTLGGTGDEVPESIIEASNGDLLICGTNTQGGGANTQGGYSSVFLMRMDKNGEFKN